MSNEVFASALDLLCNELDAYCAEHGIVPNSADELQCEYLAIASDDACTDEDRNRARKHAAYFEAFGARWDAVMYRDTLITRECGEVSFGNLGNCEEIEGSGGDEDKQEALCERYQSGNLKSVVPNIVFRIGGVEHLLTWDEAAAIGAALVKEARICENG